MEAWDPAAPPEGISWLASADRTILDTRPLERAVAGHLPGSAWLPVADPSSPAGDLPSLMLPPRGATFVVISDHPAAARAIAVHLRSRGHDAAYLAEAFPTPDQARACGLELTTGLPTGHLWRADPFLKQHLQLLPPASAGPVVDLGCGSGRDAVFLALHGYDVLAVDQLPDALDLTRRRAAHHAVAVRTVRVDLRRPADFARVEAAGPFAAALLIRVHRADALRALPRLISPGGVAVVHAFARRGRASDTPRPAATHATGARPTTAVRRDAPPPASERRPRAALPLDELDATFAALQWQTLVALDPPADQDRALAARIALRRA